MFDKNMYHPRILCTHHPRFVADASNVVLMDSGHIVCSGSPREILSREDLGTWVCNESDKDDSRTQVGEEEGGDRDDKEEEEQEGPNLIDRETRERGRISLGVCRSYWKAIGHLVSAGILASMVLMQASRNLTDVWLAEWVTAANKTYDARRFVEKGDNSQVERYLEIYGAIGAANSAFSLARAFLFAYGGIRAARSVHRRLLAAVLRAKQAFFDSTPEGRVLNRFSSDVNTVDDSLPFILNIFLAQLFGIVGPLAVCVYSVPWFSVVLFPLCFVYLDVQSRYRPASRDIKRASSVSLSPIYSHFSETLRGCVTVRAARASSGFIEEAGKKTRLFTVDLTSQSFGLGLVWFIEGSLSVITIHKLELPVLSHQQMIFEESPTLV